MLDLGLLLFVELLGECIKLVLVDLLLLESGDLLEEGLLVNGVAKHFDYIFNTAMVLFVFANTVLLVAYFAVLTERALGYMGLQKELIVFLATPKRTTVGFHLAVHIEVLLDLIQLQILFCTMERTGKSSCIVRSLDKRVYRLDLVGGVFADLAPPGVVVLPETALADGTLALATFTGAQREEVAVATT